MKCSKYGHHEFTADEIPFDEFDYVGEFDVVATTDGALLVEKVYKSHCPECNNKQSYRLRRKRLEIVPHDALPFSDEV